MGLKKIYWLASYPKSGNTWVRLLLGACRTGVVDINNDQLGSTSDCDAYLYSSVAPAPINSIHENRIVYLRTAVLMHIIASKNTGTGHVIVKTHNARMNAGGVELIPKPLTAGAVYIVRDPRDVAISYAKHTNQTIDQAISTMGEQLTQLRFTDYPLVSYLATWSNHVNSWICDDVTMIRYEDLKSDTETELKGILDTFGIKCPLPRIRKSIRLCDIENLKQQEEKEGFKEKGAADKFFGQGKGWKNVLSENQVKKIEMDHGEMMEKLGYKLEYL